jgi:nucleoside-diphosphate-sugar epimerase
MDREPGKQVNIEGTRHVLEFVTGADVERLHYVSTVVVSGLYQAEQAECLGVVRKSLISVMTRRRRRLEPLDPEGEGRKLG